MHSVSPPSATRFASISVDMCARVSCKRVHRSVPHDSSLNAFRSPLLIMAQQAPCVTAQGCRSLRTSSASKAMLPSTPPSRQTTTYQWRYLLKFCPIAEWGPMKESASEYRELIDDELGNIRSMREILADFAAYDAGPTYWKPPGMFNAERSFSADVVDEMKQQCEWMERIALTHFRAEQVIQKTSTIDLRGHVVPELPVTQTIPFCGSSIDLMLKLGVCSRYVGTPPCSTKTVIRQFRKPSDIDDYKNVGRRCPQAFQDYSVWSQAYVQAALWRDLALHAERQSPGADKRQGWKSDCPQRQYVRKLWTMWAACMRALMSEFFMSLVICEFTHWDAPIMNEPPNVVCILVWEQATYCCN